MENATKYIGVDIGCGDKTVVSIWDGREMSCLELPEWAGNVVGLTEFQGVLVVACQHAVFRLRDGHLYPLTFSDEE